MKKYILVILLIITMMISFSSTVSAAEEEAFSLNLLNIDVDVTIDEERHQGLVTGLPTLCSVDQTAKTIQVNSLDWDALLGGSISPSEDGLNIEELMLLSVLFEALYSEEAVIDIAMLHLSMPEELPDGYKVTALADYALDDIPAFSFTLPNTVESVGRNAFGDYLMHIEVDDNPYFSKGENDPFLYYTNGEEHELVWIPSIYEGTVNIPEGTTAVAADACSFRSGVTSVVIPASVKKIGDSAFEESRDITSISFSEGLTEIGDYAFYAAGIADLDLPDSLETIGEGAFSDADNLLTVTIPRGVSSIGAGAFSSNDSLKTIEFSTEDLQNIGNNAFSGTAIEEITIPSSVETLGDYAFAWCASLSEVTFEPGSSLTAIGDGLFCGTAITEIRLPDGVTSIGDKAFSGTKLSSFTFPAGITEIPAELFAGVTTLADITIPNHVTSIGASAFAGTALTEITIPASVETIGNYAFHRCSTLTDVTFAESSSLVSIGEWSFAETPLPSIVLPEGLTEIKASAFRECTALESITIPSTLESIGNYAFHLSNRRGGLTSLVLPHGFTSIGQRAFFNQSNLETIVIPATISYLGESAFANVSLGGDQTLVFLGGTPPAINSAFNNPHAFDAIYVPRGSKAAYLAELRKAANMNGGNILDTLTTATFDANGGSGSIPSLGIWDGSLLHIPPCTFTRDDALLDCWSLNKEGTQPIHTPQYTITRNTTIYVAWYAPAALSGYNGSALSDSTTHSYIGNADLVLGVTANPPNTISCEYKWYSVESAENLSNYLTLGTELPCTEGTLTIEDAPIGTYYRVCFVTAATESGEILEKAIPFSVTIQQPVHSSGSHGKDNEELQNEITSSGSFDDVPTDSYYNEAVTWAVKKEITTGTSATTFSPQDTCTRAQIVTFLWRSAGSPKPTTTTNPFTDTTFEDYYFDAVLWANENGITLGTGDGTTFSPDADCTRAQIVTFLWRAQNSPSSLGSASFSDIAENAYYNPAVQWALENGITNGAGNVSSFSPDDNCTRAQSVTFLYRCLEK